MDKDLPPFPRIGTRGSPLAMAQARLVAVAIERACPPCRAALVPITTRGDRTAGPLDAVGGKGLFTAELEAALREGRVHLAVHSAKDLPAQMPADLVLAGVPPREDPRDALVTRHGESLADLPPRAAVGTGSLRRAAQLTTIRADLKIVPLRGNVETRVRKLLEDRSDAGGGALEAVVLAMAGLKRSGLLETHRERIHALSIEEFIPAAGQGALALQCAAAGAASRAVAERITDADSLAALRAEREVVRALGADCRSCLAVHIRAESGGWRGLAMVAHPDGSDPLRCAAWEAGPAPAAEALLEALRRGGAPDRLRG
jgi:hydroxymethylbilane synthase